MSDLVSTQCPNFFPSDLIFNLLSFNLFSLSPPTFLCSSAPLFPPLPLPSSVALHPLLSLSLSSDFLSPPRSRPLRLSLPLPFLLHPSSRSFPLCLHPPSPCPFCLLRPHHVFPLSRPGSPRRCDTVIITALAIEIVGRLGREGSGWGGAPSSGRHGRRLPWKQRDSGRSEGWRDGGGVDWV